jgi:hypothetical protein
MVSLLHRLNVTYKKPKLIPGKVNEEAKKLFSQELQNKKNSHKQTNCSRWGWSSTQSKPS